MSREMLHVNSLHFQWQRASAWAFSLPNTRQDVMQACFALEAQFISDRLPLFP